MARKRLTKKEQASLDRLKDLVTNYYENKEDEKTIKKLVSEQNADIKRLLMENDNLKTSDGDYIYNTGTIVAKLADKVSKTLNEDKLLSVAKKYKISGIVKTKEYIDMDALEDMMYKGQLSAEIKQEIAKCEEIKRTPTLTVKAMTKKGDK